jgi:hypothetical protein
MWTNLIYSYNHYFLKIYLTFVMLFQHHKYLFWLFNKLILLFLINRIVQYYPKF